LVRRVRIAVWNSGHHRLLWVLTQVFNQHEIGLDAHPFKLKL
jgi:hypothetical protein